MFRDEIMFCDENIIAGPKRQDLLIDFGSVTKYGIGPVGDKGNCILLL